MLSPRISYDLYYESENLQHRTLNIRLQALVFVQDAGVLRHSRDTWTIKTFFRPASGFRVQGWFRERGRQKGKGSKTKKPFSA